MTYQIQQSDQAREAFEEYKYEIFKDEVLVAVYWHDYRGDAHRIQFTNKESIEWPFGVMTDFLTGGGPEPLGLSEKAIEYLDQQLASQKI